MYAPYAERVVEAAFVTHGLTPMWAHFYEIIGHHQKIHCSVVIDRMRKTYRSSFNPPLQRVLPVKIFQDLRTVGLDLERYHTYNEGTQLSAELFLVPATSVLAEAHCET